MIDWEAKVNELKRMADELDGCARQSDGRQKLVLGRLSDELLIFANQIAYLLGESGDPNRKLNEPLPDWLWDDLEDFIEESERSAEDAHHDGVFDITADQPYEGDALPDEFDIPYEDDFD